MKPKILIFILMLLMVTAGSSVWAGGRQEKAEEEARQEIAAIWENYCESVEQNDSATFISLHEMDAYKMPPQEPMFLIRDAAPNMQAAWDEDAEMWDNEMSIDWDEIIIHDDVAWSMGNYEIISTPKNGGAPAAFKGKFLTILRKQDDGSWKIYRDCFNSNQPM